VSARRFVCALLLAGSVGLPAALAESRDETPLTVLRLPRAPAAHEAVWLSVTVGALPRGAGVRVEAADGSIIELLTSFGAHPGTGGARFTVPLPKKAVSDGEVRIRLTVMGAGPPHAPSAQEVSGIKPIFVPVTP